MDREGLIALWRSRVEKVKLRYDFACNHAKEVQRDYPQFSTSDGSFAFQQALRLENTAREEYAHVLQTLTDLLMDGKIPDENEWRAQA